MLTAVCAQAHNLEIVAVDFGAGHLVGEEIQGAHFKRESAAAVLTDEVVVVANFRVAVLAE